MRHRANVICSALYGPLQGAEVALQSLEQPDLHSVKLHAPWPVQVILQPLPLQAKFTAPCPLEFTVQLPPSQLILAEPWPETSKVQAPLAQLNDAAPWPEALNAQLPSGQSKVQAPAPVHSHFWPLTQSLAVAQAVSEAAAMNPTNTVRTFMILLPTCAEELCR